MSDEPKGVSFQPGQGTVPGSSSQDAGKETQTYITRDDFDKSVKELQQQLQRMTQSLTDQAESRINKRVNQRMTEIDRVAKLANMTPEQVNTLKQQAMMDEITRVEDAQPSASQAQPAQAGKQEQKQPGDDLSAYANAGAKRLEKKYGVSLTTADPEAASLPQTGDPDAWLDAYEAALQAKKQRAEIPPQARIASVGTGSNANIASAEAQYKNEMLQNRGKGYQVMTEIKEKYRKLGVNVDGVSLIR